jgi:hypothetical protein
VPHRANVIAVLQQKHRTSSSSVPDLESACAAAGGRLWFIAWSIDGVTGASFIHGLQKRGFFSLDFPEARVDILYPMHRAFSFLASPGFLHLETGDSHVCLIGTKYLINLSRQSLNVL